MKVNATKNNVIFRSGYPTFSSSGHLSYKPESLIGHINLPYSPDVMFEHIYFKPTGILEKEEPKKLDYFA